MKRDLIEKVLKIEEGSLNAFSTGLLQGKAYRVLNQHLSHTLLQFNLTIPEWKLLGQLYDHGDMKLADLAERLSVEAPLVTNLVDKLEKKGLVKRKSIKSDRRAKIIIADESIHELIPQIEYEVKKTMALLLNGTTHEQLTQYIKVLETIVNNG